GVVIGYLGFRFGLRGFYVVLLTVAFAEICRIVGLNTDAIGGGPCLLLLSTRHPRHAPFHEHPLRHRHGPTLTVRAHAHADVAARSELAALGIAAGIE